MKSGALEDTVLILAPIGQDAKLTQLVLQKENIESRAIASIAELCTMLSEPVAAVLITEESFSRESSALLKQALAKQELWSDLPIVMLTSKKERLFNTQQVLDTFSVGGNISLLERPLRILTLVTAIKAALKARAKQYQVRSLLLKHEAAVRQRDEFLSVASHELKTPITSLKLQVQIRQRFIQRGDRSVYNPDKVDALIQTTDKQINRISRLVDDMLDVSRIENSKLSLNKEEAELGRLVEQVLEGFAGQFEAVGCRLSVDIAGEAFGLWDRYRLEQVVANLFTNAIKYGSGHPVHVTVDTVGESARFSVRDQGIGIAPEDHARVFQRFERAISGGNISGLGLGLYITKQIVEMHNGSIALESAVGKGSTFTVTLPLGVDAHDR